MSDLPRSAAGAGAPALPALPIDAALPALLAALAAGPCAVLAAPPGAGKTTRVPPALLAAAWATGRIVMLEPRRIAARAAAERIAEERGERVGRSVGYRIRGESRVCAATRIEVVTEGVLTRMLQDDPALTGISALVFDEIHERSIHSDLGLALAREAQEALRPDLRLLAMSATLDTARVAALLGDAPVVASEGRLHPVETRWLDAPWQGRAGRGGPRLEDAAADLVCRALGETAGDILVFLPGAGEIGRVAARLAGRTGGAALRALHGSLPFAEQRRALAAEAEGRRRIVLATAIAETSLTVEGVRVVVDAGRARRAEVNAATGLSRLVTVPVSRAEADQRRGRAGRLGPGTCYRMWTRGEEGALPAFAVPEILSADLAPLALELALWGAADPAALAFADPPPAGALAEARALLAGLGALDARGGITEHGRAIARFPAHPRLAHMVLAAQREGRGGLAARLAALLGARDPLRRDGPNPAPADLALRVAALRDPGRLEAEHPLRVDRDAVARIREEAKRLDPDAKASGGTEEAGAIAGLLTLAWPDRVALRRPGDAPRYLLANGRGAAFAPGEPLGAARLVVAVDVDDTGRDARIRLAAALTEADLRARHGPSIAWVEVAAWSPRHRRVEAETREMFGAIALARQAWRAAPPEALGAALADGIRDLGLAALPWSPAAESLRARVRWLAAQGDTMPDWSDAALLEDLDDWLTPYLAGLTRVDQIPPAVLETALATALGREHAAVLEAAAPERFATPLGGAVRIDYARAEPTLTIRVQELFGLNRHPCVGNPPIPLVLELTSPAGRPVQTTRDLPGFWAESYRDVRKDMRARYPKHPWPEDPLSASPTRRAKPRKR